jgi:predicted nucleic acid-binding protein
VLVLDSGGVSFLAKRNQDTVAAIRALVRDGQWPPIVPSVVLAEALTGRQREDAAVNRLLKTCDVNEELPVPVARRAGELRHRARRGSAVDALVVATAEPGGVVLGGDVADLGALASHADGVRIERV